MKPEVEVRRAQGVLALAVLLTLVLSSAASASPPRAAGSRPGPLLAGGDVAVAHHEGGTVDFDAGWRFALVNPAGVTDPTGAYAEAASPAERPWRSSHPAGSGT